MDIFNWQYYLNLYPELKAAGINTPQAALNHWILFGINEGRKCYENLNDVNNFYWQYYLSLYKDLRDADLNTPERAFEHWIAFGMKEGRKCNKITDYFNCEYYLNLYPDLKAAGINTPQAALNHWFSLGINEGRKCYENCDDVNNFDWQYYLSLYKDLRDADLNTPQKAFEHWISFGVKEDRKCNRIMNNDMGLIYKSINVPEKIYCPEIETFNKEIIDNTDNTNFICDIDSNDFKICILHDCDLLRTRQYNTPEKIPCPEIDDLNDYDEFILIIDFPNGGGGTTHFLNCVVSKFKKSTTFLIARNFDGLVYFYINDMLCLKKQFNHLESIAFLDEIKDKIIKIFVNHTIDHNIEFINKIFDLDKHVTTITHDYSSIIKKVQPYYQQIAISERAIIDINKYDMIITQNIVNTNIYNNYINPNKIIISELPDYYKSDKLINTNNSQIVIGFIGAISNIKGCEIINNIYKFYMNNKNIKFIIFGSIDVETDIPNIRYNSIDELNELLITYKPNLIIETSIWPETYSYTLTLAMLTNLPILYIKKSYDAVIENRLIQYKKAYPITNITDINKIIYKVKQNYFYTIDTTIYFNSFWDKYFTPSYNLYIKKHKLNIKPYCIYFPQFHTFPENDNNFYKGYTDIENLKLLKDMDNKIDILSPSLRDFNLTKFTDYNLLNTDIIQRQIDIITEYNISGFAMYYYWFSKNSISDNMLMKPVIDHFFNNTINMNNRKIFFIWANESWTNNEAFGISKHEILNTYKPDELNKNIDNLITYFKHENYLKIDNKPVFFLHHPWFLSDNEINIFYNLLNNRCIQNNYEGIHFVINSMNKKYDNFINYHHTFNYKRNSAVTYNSNKQHCELNYKKYISEYNNNSSIHTLAFDFDNRARLCKPNKLKLATVCINNDENTKITFINKIVDKYDKSTTSDVENILLINAWNEWGEKMVIEPSEQQGHYYLNLIKEYITRKL
jgi:hypothetical protein